MTDEQTPASPELSRGDKIKRELARVGGQITKAATAHPELAKLIVVGIACFVLGYIVG